VTDTLTTALPADTLPAWPVTGLTLLGNQVRGAIRADELETFPAPEGVSMVTFTTEELTAFCPVTGQPDLYRMTFTYRPRLSCVESKALKLYLVGFRDRGVFCEALAAQILHDLVRVLDPVTATVVLRQQVRGGLALTTRADYGSEQR